MAGDGGLPEPLRLAAIAAVMQVRRPTAATIGWLVRLLDAPEPKVRKQATLLAGAVGRIAVDAGAHTGADVETELLRRYSACSGAACDDLLIGLGNLGTSGVEPAVAEALRAPSARARALAVQALRRVNHPDVDRLIATALTGDRDPAVRSAAVGAAASRPLGAFVGPLTDLVRTDKVAHVRIHAIQAIADHVDQWPQIQQALLAAASDDPDPGAQRMARRALGPRFTKGL